MNVTRSLVRDDSPALQALLNIWQSIAGARADPHRNGNVREICEFLLDQSARFLDDERYSDYIEAARLIAVELHRHSSLAVLDCLLQRFETLDVSLQAQSDPVAALRTPCTLLSAIIGSRFQTCRARLPAILQHIFVWLPFPGSPCSEVPPCSCLVNGSCSESAHIGASRHSALSPPFRSRHVDGTDPSHPMPSRRPVPMERHIFVGNAGT